MKIVHSKYKQLAVDWPSSVISGQWCNTYKISIFHTRSTYELVLSDSVLCMVDDGDQYNILLLIIYTIHLQCIITDLALGVLVEKGDFQH